MSGLWLNPRNEEIVDIIANAQMSPFPTHPCPCHRGRQISPTCSGTADSGQHHAGQASSGWRTARRRRWGSWGWRRMCAELHRRRSGCSWSSCHRIRRWHIRPWRTGSRLETKHKKSGNSGHVRFSIAQSNQIRASHNRSHRMHTFENSLFLSFFFDLVKEILHSTC